MSDQEQPVFSIEKLYVKDLSLEVPNAPGVFLNQEGPTISIELHNAVSVVNDGLYNVVLTVTVTAKHEDKTFFLVEVGQAGIFQIRNVPQESIDPILGVTCPTILFPYLREAISDTINRAGFPPVLLAPVNFEAMYQQRAAEQAAQPAPAQVQ
ncbi:MAG: protein-export chaperone SecB [Georgfuchsia sp.]